MIKVFRDIRIYTGRSLLTLVGVAIGTAAIGAVLSAYAILNREMNRNFMETNPASMVLVMTMLDEKAVEQVKRIYPQTEIELRKTIQARVGKGDGTYGTIYLRAICDFEGQRVDTFTLEKGHFPVEASEMTLERDSLKIIKNVKTGIGEELQIILPGAGEKTLRLSGLLHAPGLAPASMENYAYGFVRLDTLKSLGYQGWYDEMRIVSRVDRMDRQAMQKMAMTIRSLLIDMGYTVKRVEVPKPGKHPHAAQLSSFLFLLQAFTVIALLVACIIIINLLNFIMAKQIRQIAVMKTVGASVGDIAFPYFIYVMVICLGSLIPGIPLALMAGKGYSVFAAYILNFKISSFAVPAWVIISQVLTGILVPLVSAFYPIFKSCTQSVKDGLNGKSTGVGDGKRPMYLKTWFVNGNSRIIMPLNNLIRKKTRTILAVLALTAGGALFMTAQNMVASIDKTVNLSMDAFRWDYNIQLARVYPETLIERILEKMDGFDRFEVWRADTALLKKGDGLDSAYYQIKVVPEDTQLLNLSETAEKAIKSGEGAIVVTNGLLEEEEWLRTGMTIPLEVSGQTAEVVIADVVDEVPPMTIIYMGRKAYAQFFGEGSRQVIMASAITRDKTGQQRLSRMIEDRFKTLGIKIADNWNIYLLRKAFVDHLRVIVTFLSGIALLAVLVGGLSIASAIGININERRREIGVLRAVGVGRQPIIGMIVLEVFLMGVAGWLAGLLISIPLSISVGNYFGQIFLKSNLMNTLSSSGAVVWLFLSIAASIVAGSIPAWSVANAPLREMLGYE